VDHLPTVLKSTGIEAESLVTVPVGPVAKSVWLSHNDFGTSGRVM
jgi:hypothetical protein